MSQEPGNALAIQLPDGRTVIATPGPEDQGRLAQIGDGPVTLSAGATQADTYGHSYSNELNLDVEGHAITLRLPTPADAEALRKALAIGLVTATIVAAGAIASLQGSPGAGTPQVAAPAVPAAAPAPMDLAAQREDRLAEQDPLWDSQVGGAPGVTTSDGQGADTHGPGRGELERNP